MTKNHHNRSKTTKHKV